MSEVTFAKSFLSTLDKRPIKLPADHVSDPKKYPNQSPVSRYPDILSEGVMLIYFTSSSCPVKPTHSPAVSDPLEPRQRSKPPSPQP